MLSTLGSTASQGGAFPLYTDGVQNVAWTTFVSNASYASLTFNANRVTFVANGWYKSSTEEDTDSYAEMKTTQDVTTKTKLCVEYDVSSLTAGAQATLTMHCDTLSLFTPITATSGTKAVVKLDISAKTGSVMSTVKVVSPFGPAKGVTVNVYRVWLE